MGYMHLGHGQDHLELLMVVFKRLSNDKSESNAMHLKPCFDIFEHARFRFELFFALIKLRLILVLKLICYVTVSVLGRAICDGVSKTAPVALSLSESEVNGPFTSELHRDIHMHNLVRVD